MTSKASTEDKGETATALIDARIRELADWRGATLAAMRALIHQADPDILEEWKWRVPVWSHGKIVCTGESYKKIVKLTFAHGAKLPDPQRLFNSSLEGNTRRAIDISEGALPDADAFMALIRAAVAANVLVNQGNQAANESAAPATKGAKVMKAAKGAMKAK